MARRNITYTRSRPVLTDGRVLLRVDTKRKDGGTFESVNNKKC